MVKRMFGGSRGSKADTAMINKMLFRNHRSPSLEYKKLTAAELARTGLYFLFGPTQI